MLALDMLIMSFKYLRTYHFLHYQLSITDIEYIKSRKQSIFYVEKLANAEVKLNRQYLYTRSCWQESLGGNP